MVHLDVPPGKPVEELAGVRQVLPPTGLERAVQGPYPRKESQSSTSQFLLPFLLKIDPNTLCIIQKFRSLVAVTGKTGPAALPIHLQGTGSQGAVAGPWGTPIKTALATASWGRGLFLEQRSPPHPMAKIRYLKVPL